MAKPRSIKEQIVELHNQGMSYKQIKEELGCSLGTISYHLGVGQRDKSRQIKKQRNNKIRQYLIEFKQSRACADCGENYPYWIMDFDHLSDKKFGISKAYLYHSLDEIKEEINKCEVVCANCHRNRTFLRSSSEETILDAKLDYPE